MDVTIIDEVIFRGIYELRHPFLDGLSVFISWLGNGWLWVSIGLVLVVSSNARRQIYGYASLLALMLSALVVELVAKPLVDRVRPYEVLVGVERLGDLPFGSSFPSGHVTTAAAMAWILAQAFPRLRYGLAVLPLLMVWSRVYNGVHWPLDVVVGWLLGTFLGWLSLGGVRSVARQR